MPTREQIGDNLLTNLSMESSHLLTLLSMDSSSSNQDERVREFNRSVNLLHLPPDINLSLYAEPSPPPRRSWNNICEMLEVTLAPQNYDVYGIIWPKLFTDQAHSTICSAQIHSYNPQPTVPTHGPRPTPCALLCPGPLLFCVEFTLSFARTVAALSLVFVFLHSLSALFGLRRA